ncbi:hypothetical protein [uncultured Psychroserpens sp.]|uniref:hypothetical protein n=1 Tax=uncultured Psychroserpens sp. TaxID=255436 RepID=UPI00263286E7|nr:hypothetical protein [uncultured Psychroserpens sp.]
MTISEEKRLVKQFYLVSLLLNVVFPLVYVRIIVGDKTGEIQFLYISVTVLVIFNALGYAVYFLIPDFITSRDKIATLYFPTLLHIGLCIVSKEIWPIVVYTILLNSVFFLIWNRKNKSQ